MVYFGLETGIAQTRCLLAELYFYSSTNFVIETISFAASTMGQDEDFADFAQQEQQQRELGRSHREPQPTERIGTHSKSRHTISLT